MAKTLAGRCGAALAVLFVVSLLTFAALHVVPGDTATLVLGTDATPQALQQLRESMGLDRSLPEQYVSWICGVLTGDWGTSRTYGAPVWQVIAQTLPVTLLLAVYATAVALAVSCVLGVASAMRPGGVVDVVSRTLMQLASAVPGFWLAVVCMLFFAANLGWFPVSGYVPLTQDPAGCVRSLTLPALVLACGELGVLIRTVRSSVMDALQQEYMLATQVKGLTRMRATVTYVLRASLSAPITVAGIQMAKLVGGTAAIERVFALPGLGNLLLGAVEQRDVMLVQGIVVFVTVAVVVVNLLVDLLTVRAAGRGVSATSGAGKSVGKPRGRRGLVSLVVGLVLVGAVTAMGLISLVWTPYDISVRARRLVAVHGGSGACAGGGRGVGRARGLRGRGLGRLGRHGLIEGAHRHHAPNRCAHVFPGHLACHGACACAGARPYKRARGRCRVHGAGVCPPDLPGHTRGCLGALRQGRACGGARHACRACASHPAQCGSHPAHPAYGAHRFGHAA